MSFTRHYFVEGHYYGTTVASPHIVHGQLQAPYGQAFFCPLCSELWANCPVEGQTSTVWQMPCGKHSFGENGIWATDLPGSIYAPWLRDFYSDLPTELLAREVLLITGGLP